MKKIISAVAVTQVLLACVGCGSARSTVSTTVQETKEIISERIETTRDKVTKATTKYKPATTTKKQTTSNPYIANNLGVFSLTFYTPYEDQWGYATSTGVQSSHLRTCAVDPTVIPLGSVILIEGDNGMKLELLACDIGGGIRGNKIDVFFDGSQSEGYAFMAKFGQIHNVYLLEE